ncbi:MAG: DUF1329 domain-containing protein [Gammaproteobacteria bacterium]|nr:DUF1329 domain-containing protein [Gammaproteobacteria bacterium]
MVKKSFGGLFRAITPIAVLMYVAGSGAALAEELAEGTVINAGNLASMESHTFEGQKIGDMLPESMKMWVRDHGLVIPLQKSRDITIPDGLKAATAKYAGTVTLDPATKLISNWVAGTPFAPHSEMSLDDPMAGYKLAWNFFTTAAFRSDSVQTEAPTLLIDGVKGIEQSQKLINYQLLFKGRTSGGPVDLAPDDAELFKKQLIIVTEPYDIAGLGSFSERYLDGRQDNAWAYVKSVRRTRRISGNVWADPLANTDLMGDDNGMMDAHPAWYKDIQLVGRRYILNPGHTGSLVTHDNLAERFDLENPPFWNPIAIGYEPKEVYVLEITNPDTHPYSRKTVYMDTYRPHCGYSEMYDRKGDFWRTSLFTMNEMEAVNGDPAYAVSGFVVADWQKMHGTVIHLDRFSANAVYNPDKFNERSIERAAKGQLQF